MSVAKVTFGAEPKDYEVQETGIGTKSQQALKLQQEQNKQERKIRSKEKKEAEKPNDKVYIQVTESMQSPETRERELRPLRMIGDNYEKSYCLWIAASSILMMA